MTKPILRTTPTWGISLAAALALAGVLGACAEPPVDHSAPFTLGGSSIVAGFTPTPTAFIPRGEAGGGNGHGADTPPPASSTDLGGTVAEGQKVFLSAGCTGCHTIEGVPGAVGKVGPDLTLIAARAGQQVSGMTSEQYLRRKVAEPGFNTVKGFPPGVMPSGLVKVGPDLDKLIAFLLSRQ